MRIDSVIKDASPKSGAFVRPQSTVPGVDGFHENQLQQRVLCQLLWLGNRDEDPKAALQRLYPASRNSRTRQFQNDSTGTRVSPGRFHLRFRCSRGHESKAIESMAAGVWAFCWAVGGRGCRFGVCRCVGIQSGKQRGGEDGDWDRAQDMSRFIEPL